MKFHLIILNLFALAFTAFGAESCSPGTVFTRGYCSRCPKGTFQPFTNQTSCFVCPDGMVATRQRRTECEPCPRFSKPHFTKTFCVCEDGRALRDGECKLCRRGTFFTRNADNSTYCRDCEEGSFQPRHGQSQCIACPAGTTSAEGGRACPSCDDNEFVTKQGTCGTCPPGRRKSEYSAGVCEKCEANTFKAEDGAGPCVPCPLGSFSKEGASECVKCPKGTKLTRKGKCMKCPRGKYLDIYSGCSKCGENEFMPYENTEEECFDCTGPFFALPGSAECTRCPQNTVLVKNGTCIECPPGHIYDQYSLRCDKCGVNEYSRNPRNVFGCEQCPKGSYSRRGSSTCFTCPTGQAFIAAKNKCGTCGPGKEYQDYGAGRCDRCSTGYYTPNAGIGPCIFCPSGESNPQRTACV